MGAGKHQWNVAGGQPDQSVVAEAVAKQDGIVAVGGIHLRLEAFGHFVGRDVVQPLLHELHVDLVGGVLQQEFHLSEKNLAAD